LKKFIVSLIYIVFLAVVSFFRLRLEALIINASARKFVIYSIYGIFIAFAVVILVKFLLARKNLEIAMGLLAMGMIFFFLFSTPLFLFKLTLLEFFILGFVVAVETRKSQSLFSFLLLLGAACLIEAITNFSGGTRFYYLDVWINSLTGLSGYIAGFLII
jgi:hypothetical protein